ncbi:hypothetical protein Q8A73_004252 [Channa argus]|nr:hypothetical protein Q8A73_004252 [Channa argus]
MDGTSGPPLCFPNLNSSCRRLLRPPSETVLLYTLLAFVSLLTSVVVLPPPYPYFSPPLMDNTGSPHLCFPNLNSSCRRLLRHPSEAVLLYTLLAFVSLLTIKELSSCLHLYPASLLHRWTALQAPLSASRTSTPPADDCYDHLLRPFYSTPCSPLSLCSP